MKSKTAVLVTLVVCTVALVQGAQPHNWVWDRNHFVREPENEIVLTPNNGAKCHVMHLLQHPPYDEDTVSSIVFTDEDENAEENHVFNRGEANDIIGEGEPDPEVTGFYPSLAHDPAGGGGQKHVSWCTPDLTGWYCDTVIPYYGDNWATSAQIAQGLGGDSCTATAAARVGEHDQVYVCLYAVRQGSAGVWFHRSENNGHTWLDPVQVAWCNADGISLAARPYDGGVFVAFHTVTEASVDQVHLYYSADRGVNGSWCWLRSWDDATQPSVAVIGSRVFVAFVRTTGTDEGRVFCDYSHNIFVGWRGTERVSSYRSTPGWVYSAPTISMCEVDCGSGLSRLNVLIVSELDGNGDRWISATHGLWSGHIVGAYWSPYREVYICREPDMVDENANPCVAMLSPNGEEGPWLARCAWVDADVYALWYSPAWFQPISLVVPCRPVDATGRQLQGEADGTNHYTAVVGGNVVAGRVLPDGYLEPILVNRGASPTLAVAPDGRRWVALVNADTLWAKLGDGTYKPVFCGSSSARPGQPSIEVYPDDGSGFVGAVAFPVYDSTGESSMILWAKFDAENLLLDTIASVANLRDSCPSINIAYGDSVYVVWQRGDSVVSAKLLDYGPSDWNRPPAWSDLELVTANGYHPSSRLEGGDMLHAVWSERVEVTGGTDTFNICRATCDVSPTSMFQDWTAGTNPSAGNAATAEKGNPVYAGCGVSVWQEQVSGVWNIYARVRDSIHTLVANDTDAYHPHAVACSSAISPSIDQIRLSTLFTAGVTYEVDSGVYDTGEVRFRADSFNVSNAGPGATKSNNGTKLVQKPGSDSLFAVYADASGGVYFAWSASGDSWKRAVLTENGREPAISRDGTGRLWTVYLDASEQEVVARYRVGDTWSTVKTLYPVEPGEDNVSGISFAGSPDDANSCAYAAFRYTNSGLGKFIIAAKFNADSLRVDTVANGEVNDPCIAVENSGGNGDWLHVAYEPNGNVVYTMTQDDWAADDWQGFPDWEQEVMLFESGQQTARHPCLAANADKLVIACAEGATPDVFVRERATTDDYDNWAEAVNLSNTEPHGSDYPVVFLGDSIAVVWEEARSVQDHDILASINYGDTFELGGDATQTSYPHIVLQSVTSPDTTVILHLLTSEKPSTDYYEVGYQKFDLADMGGGQQSAGTTPARIQPELFPAQPNPFNRATSIRYQTAQTGHVLLQVCDASGRVVSTLENSTRKPGRYATTWDGTDTRGHKMANGIYFYRLDAPGFRSVKKAVLMR